MADLIDRDKVIEAIDDISIEIDEGYGFQYEKWRKYFCELPSVPRKGKWIQNDNGTWSCDQCNSWIPNEQHYYANWCLYCGADMREG